MALSSNKLYFTVREIAKDLAGDLSIREIPAKGIENQGIFTFNNRILKFTYSTQEAKACTRLVGKKFHNVVKVFAVHRFMMCGKGCKKFTIYAIEQERLKKDKSFDFEDVNLEDFITRNPRRSIFQVKKIIDDILNAYIELDSVGVVYKDLHSDNIMRDAKGNLKLIDFGFACVRRRVVE